MERRITLTDVMLGIDKHGLVCKLTEESFTFLIGIILEHNRQGFRDGFDMNNNQAMAAGGGNTPKSVRRRRLTLSKFKIDGRPLLKYESGNYGRNTSAKYEINYKSLLAYNGVWSGQTDLPAQIWGSSGHSRGPVEGTVEGTVEGPILRSEQKREEEDPHTIPNVVTTGKRGEKVSGNGTGGDSFKVEKEKDQEEARWIKGKLSQQGVKDPWKTEIAERYETRYIVRQIRQIRRDDPDNERFTNHAGVLVARIKSGSVPEDFPEEMFANWQWPGASSDNL